MKRSLEISRQQFKLKKPFRIARSEVAHVETLLVSISEDGITGFGECRPYPRYDESFESVKEQIETLRSAIEQEGLNRKGLLEAMPSGAARNAVDASLFDLEAKTTGTPCWSVAGLLQPAPVMVTYTLGLDSPERMAREALETKKPLYKLKLGARGDAERLKAVREAVPDAALIADANEGWSIDDLKAIMPVLKECDLKLLEQPVKAGEDHRLEGVERLVPLCADESVHDHHDVQRLIPFYDYVNIKLDKAGGLTGAIALRDEAQAHGLGIMLGCMMASSLSMAQAFPLAAYAEFVDLDAPLLLAEDRSPPCLYDGAVMQVPERALWG